jgi:hypothetical protein
MSMHILQISANSLTPSKVELFLMVPKLLFGNRFFCKPLLCSGADDIMAYICRQAELGVKYASPSRSLGTRRMPVPLRRLGTGRKCVPKYNLGTRIRRLGRARARDFYENMVISLAARGFRPYF